MHAPPTFLWALTGVAFLGGCAVNDHGLVRVELLENDTAYLLRLETWGVHLMTEAADCGVTVGYSRRTYVFLRGDGAATLPWAAVTDPASQARPLREASCDPCPGLAQLGAPLLLVGETAGVSLDANSRRVGLALGLRRHAALEIPPDQNLVLFLHYNSQHEPSAEVTVGKEIGP